MSFSDTWDAEPKSHNFRCSLDSLTCKNGGGFIFVMYMFLHKARLLFQILRLLL